jgi:uncharacterized membrane protein (DUF2068 family)
VSRRTVPREARRLTPRRRGTGWPRRFWHELGSLADEHDGIVRLIIIERLAKSAVLVVLAASLVAADRLGYLRRLADLLQEQLNLNAGGGLIARLLTWIAEQLGHLLPHVTLVALAVLLYAALEATEGVGLAMRRRWAEYLTVLATGVFIPYELLEVVARPTPFRVAALLVNAGIVVYLAWRKRLFVDV